MRRLLRLVLPFVPLLSGAASAVEIDVGGRTIEIPIPPGYSELTPEMSPAYETMYAYVMPTNERYLILVPTEVAEAFLRGKEADYDRYMVVEAERQAIRFDVSQAQFDEFRELMRTQLDEMYESVRQQLPEVFDDASDSMSEVLDADLAVSVGEIVPFEPHVDQANAIAFSQLIGMGIAVGGEDLGSEVGAATATVLHVRNKMIFAYVYGREDDLEWTRVFSSNWVDDILAANTISNTAQTVEDSSSTSATDETGAASDSIRSFALGPAAKFLLGLFAALLVIFAVRTFRGKESA